MKHTDDCECKYCEHNRDERCYCQPCQYIRDQGWEE